MRRLLVTCAVLFSCAASLRAQIVPCESFGKAYRECRIASSGRVQLVTEFSDRLCFEGLTWGTSTAGTVWVKNNCRATFTVVGPGAPNALSKSRVVCESTKGNREVCSADTEGGVALVQQLSKAACVQDESWGIDHEFHVIWVDRGCRGEFQTGRQNVAAPSAPVLDSVVVCQSEDKRRKTCKADTVAGVQLVRQLSESRCGFGREWGWDADGIWVAKGCRAEFVVQGKPKPTIRTVTCESEDRARKECPADTQFGVALVKQLGGVDCVLGTSWDFDEKGIWVADGCRGQFALGGFRLAPEAVPPTATKMICESLDGGHKQCPVDAVRGAGLIQQLSGSDCIFNRTWGYDRNGIWVTNGCRAEFAVAH